MRNGHKLFARRTVVAVAVLAACGAPMPALASEFDTGNEHLQVRFDTTARYNLGVRMQDRKSVIANNSAFDEGDFLFDKHDLITNRVDLLGEFDLVWKRQLGVRVSASAWADSAYGSMSARNPALAAPPSYVGQRFTSAVTRFYRGPSGEFLDAFVFANYSFDDGRTASVKLGRHAVVWGEGLFGSTNAISYGQAPNDSRKAVGNPGASAKETALPISQLSGSVQLLPELALLGQYTFEWRPNRLPEGGTFFGGADIIQEGPNVGRGAPERGDKGDVGAGIRWSPAWLDGSLGGYYRKFDDKGSWTAQPNIVGTAFLDTRAVYVRNVEILGLSLAKNVAGVSLAAELSYRKNGALNSIPTASAGAGGRYEGAVGNTWHGVLNGIATFGGTALFDSASLAAELSWSRLDQVKRNAALFRAPGFNSYCNTETRIKGCADDNFFGTGFTFTPVWLQVIPGADLSMPVFVSYNPKGNAASNGGGSVGALTAKIGASLVIHNRYVIDVAYNGYHSKVEGARILGAPYNDKGWLGVTLQTTF